MNNGRFTKELRDHAQACEAAGHARDALAAVWEALELEPDEQETKIIAARLLRNHPGAVAPNARAHVASLLRDRYVSPISVAPAGWQLLLRDHALSAAKDDPGAMAAWLESDTFAQDLLRETAVTNLDVEIPLTSLRRWLLLSNRWREFPRSVEALAAQAEHNQGAWLFDLEERARLDADPDSPMARAYGPRQQPHDGETQDFAEPVTKAVARQYEGWPYPRWTRITVPEATSLGQILEELDPHMPRHDVAENPEILIAGCGTGQDAVTWAHRLPTARITAIDLSRPSLDYAARRCAETGASNIVFRALDLHDVATLQRRFDAISVTGVLHHLPDPEKGWAALVATLKPGGIMRVMLYSRVARRVIGVARRFILDLRDQPVDADLLRAVRARLIEKARGLVSGSRDFYVLSSVHDLLLHPHEDPFDVPRIAKALDRLGLKLLRFNLPTPAHKANYRARHPSDPFFRDMEAWAKLEDEDSFLFSRMYDFWCRKPLS